MICAEQNTQDTLSSTVLHPMGNIMATTSGQKDYREHADNMNQALSAAKDDSSLDIWLLP